MTMATLVRWMVRLFIARRLQAMVAGALLARRGGPSRGLLATVLRRLFGR